MDWTRLKSLLVRVTVILLLILSLERPQVSLALFVVLCLFYGRIRLGISQQLRREIEMEEENASESGAVRPGRRKAAG